MAKSPYDPEAEQPYLTGVPDFYDDKSELKEDIAAQNRRWEEAGRKARAVLPEPMEVAVDTPKALLDLLVNENRTLFNQFMAETKKDLGDVLQQSRNEGEGSEKSDTLSPPHDLLDRWFKRFAVHKYDIEHTTDLREVNRLRTALYNDAIATLFDIGLELSKLISAVESR
jgi:hypothetical protein